MKKKLVLIILNLLLSAVTFCAPKNIFMFIGDGLGSSQRQVSQYYKEEVLNDKKNLVMNSFPVAGINTTHSLDTLVTDSAAAGTALATGYKTNNGMISMLPNGDKLKTIIEYAKENNMKTGIISTTRLTHATPAVFASHNESRGNENEIAEEMVSSQVDFFAGGGYRNFIPKNQKDSKRKDDKNLVKILKEKNYETFIGESSSNTFKKSNFKNKKVFAAFTKSHLPYEIDRQNIKPNLPSLGEITEKAIESLENDKGFFMMVEGGRIDHAAHANDVKSVIYDTLAFDDAVAKAYEFYKKNPNDTLILVVGDHETGGLGLGYGKNYFLKLEELKDMNISVEDVLQKSYSGNKNSYLKYIEKYVKNLTNEEKNNLEKAMKEEDKGKSVGSYKPTAIAVAHILDKRANLMFTTYAHTGTQIPLSVIGKDAYKFSGFIDNTKIGKNIIELIK